LLLMRFNVYMVKKKGAACFVIQLPPVKIALLVAVLLGGA
jgi:hypothetical protein